MNDTYKLSEYERISLACLLQNDLAFHNFRHVNRTYRIDRLKSDRAICTAIQRFVRTVAAIVSSVTKPRFVDAEIVATH